MNLKPPKRQHFVPRLHLQHFAGGDPKGHVWTYDAQTGQCRSAVPEETAVEAHFYSAERLDGTMDTTLEEILAGFESAAAPIYEGLLRGVVPTAAATRARMAEMEAEAAVMQARLEQAEGRDARATSARIAPRRRGAAATPQKTER